VSDIALNTGDWASQFSRLSQLLNEQQSLWRPRAFTGNPLDWLQAYPGLGELLLALPAEEIEVLQGDSGALTRLLQTELPFAGELHQVASLPPCEPKKLPPFDAHFHVGIPGRKWQQLQAFVACLPQTAQPAYLEWCAGKAHLGRCVHQLSGLPVTSLEWDAQLVSQGQARADRAQMMVALHRVDVLSAQANAYLQPAQHALALHACGPLHRQLMSQAIERGVRQLSIAPCCYQKCDLQPGQYHQPLSGMGRCLDLGLTRAELFTAVQETVTASGHVRRQRVQLQQWRLGFDRLQRDLRGVDAYWPVPSLPGRLASTDFKTFCQAAAQCKGLALPERLDWRGYEQAGREQYWRVSALDLVRQLFRRPLEVWLVLDYALYLQEHGYRVALGTFCERHLTPRNILLNGRL